jgi:aryl-alcohol dehydrogenase-like predicted oxidoreductase
MLRPLPSRELGQGLSVSCIGLGCMNLSMGYGGPPPEAEWTCPALVERH